MSNQQGTPVLQFKENQEPEPADKKAKIGKAINDLVVKNHELDQTKAELEQINKGLRENLQASKAKITALETRITEQGAEKTELEAKLQASEEAKDTIKEEYVKIINRIKGLSPDIQEEDPMECLGKLAERLRMLNGQAGIGEKDVEEKRVKSKEKRKNLMENREERKERKERVRRKAREQQEEEDISACKIDAESVTDLLQGEDWKILIKNPTDYQRKVNEKSVKIAVVGDEETGKTFTLKKLLGYDHSYGKHVKTNGLCVLYPKEDNKLWTALDTPGRNMAVQTELVKKELEGYFKAKGMESGDVEKIVSGDKIIIEKMIQEFVMKKVEILLIVVGKLRREDQKFINKIKERKDLKGKRIIIVHNLMDLTEKEDVKEVIQEDIINTFDAYERIIDVPNKQGSQTVYSEGGTRKIDHVVMAEEESPAGEFYNETAIAYLKQIISVGDMTSNFDFVQEFTENVEKSLKDYITSTSKTPGEMISMQRNDEHVPFGLKLSQPEECIMKVDCVEEIEEVQKVVKGGSVEFPYTVKMTKKKIGKEQEEERYVKLEFELTGKCEDKDIRRRVEIKENQVVIKVKGKSDDNTKRGSEEEEEICFNNRKFGEFEIVTDPIELKECTVHMDDRGMISSDTPGLKVISWRLYTLHGDNDDSF